MSKQIKRQVLIKGQPVEGLFKQISKNEIIVSLGYNRFTIEKQSRGLWRAASLNATTFGRRGFTPFEAYCNFVRDVFNTHTGTGDRIR